MAETKQKKSKKGLIIGIVVVVIVALLIFGVTTMAGGQNSNYLSTIVSQDTIETYYTFSGNVQSSNTQNVMAEGILQISEIKVSEGSDVKAEDVLFVTADGAEIKAEIDGTVNEIFVETDQQVISGSQLCEIIDFENLEVTVKVDEYDHSTLEVGDSIDVIVGSLDKEIEGTVSKISRTATNQNGVAYFNATISLEYDSEVKVGMTVEAKVLNEKSKDTLVIPMRALNFDEDNNPYVYTMDSAGKMKKTTIVLGINDGKNVEIKSGLSNGQTIYYQDTTADNNTGAAPQFPGAGL